MEEKNVSRRKQAETLEKNNSNAIGKQQKRLHKPPATTEERSH